MIIWSEPVSVAGDGWEPFAGHVVRLELTAIPGWSRATANDPARYRGLGIIGESLDEEIGTTVPILVADGIYGPFDQAFNSVYYSLAAGVTADLSKGYLVEDGAQPSGLLGIATTHALPNDTGTTITWQTILGGIGQLPMLADLRKQKITVAGLYLAEVLLALPTATYTRLQCRLMVGGVLRRWMFYLTPGTVHADGIMVGASVLLPLAAGDEVTIYVLQTSGAARDLASDTRWSLARQSDL